MDILIFLIVLSILVIVHEWGHFFTARSLGVDVEKFSVGFGPKIISKKHKGTEFLVSAIPLGGYVKLAGDDRNTCKGAAGEFYSHPVGHRALVVLMGPVVNFVFAFISLWIIFMVGFPGSSTRIMYLEAGGAAQAAGVLKGDKILEVNNEQVHGQMHLERVLRKKTDGPLQLKVQRGDAVMVRQLTPELVRKENDFGEKEWAYDIGVDFYSNEIGWVAEDSPAQKAGLRHGDVITAINGVPILGWPDIKTNISDSSLDVLPITYERDGQKTTIQVTPTTRTFENEEGEEVEMKIIGISPIQEVESYRFGFFDSMRHSVSELWNIISLTLKTLGKVITGSLSAKRAIGGPIRIFSVVSNAAATGILSLIYVMAVISASLGLFNLFPVPILDGGHIFLFLIERLRGRPLPLKWEENLNKVGFTALMVLMVFVIYNDIVEIGLLRKISDFVTKIK